MSKASKHPSTKAIAKMGYVTLDPADAKVLLGSKKLVDRVVGAVYGESRVKKLWVKETFDGSNDTQFLELKTGVGFPRELRVLAVCPNGAYSEAFFLDLDNGDLDFLVVVEQEARRPFGERPEEKRRREALEEQERVSRLNPHVRAMMAVRQVVENEGFDYAFRSYSDFSDVPSRKFHALRQAYMKAAAALENFIAE